MQKLITQKGGGGQKMKILVLGPNSTKFYTHNLWAIRRLEMQKLSADGECGAGVQGARCGDGIGGRCVQGCKGWVGMGLGRGEGGGRRWGAGVRGVLNEVQW